jgi:ATP/ADP translocase
VLFVSQRLSLGLTPRPPRMIILIVIGGDDRAEESHTIIQSFYHKQIMADDDEHDSSGSANAPLKNSSSPLVAFAAAASSSPETSAPSSAIMPIFNSLNDFADEEDENNDSSAHPLLSSIKKKVKMGSFSIRYNPHQQQQRVGQYYSRSANNGSSSQFHDFTSHEDAHYNDQSDSDDDDDDDLISNLHYNRSNTTLVRRFLIHRLKHFSNHSNFLPLRILLLSLYLAFTLSSFWILDSIKEPTLAILVDGNLGKHQPRAKMVSFVVVIGLAVGMEWLDRFKRLQQQQRNATANKSRRDNTVDRLNEELEQSWSERNLPLSMRMMSSMDSSNSSSSDDNYVRTKWRSMKVRSSKFWNHFAWRDTSTNADDDDHNGESSSTYSSSKITTMAFYIVGSFYIHGFVTVAIALKTHPSFRSSAIFHNVNQVAELESVGGLDVYQSSVFSSTPVYGGDDGNGGHHADWYYPTLGYVLFALVESFGSVSITLFWAFANSHLTLESAERHYGSIVAVAQMGAIAGSTLSAVWGGRRRQQQDDIQQQQQHLILDEEGRVDVDMSVDVREGDAHVTPMLIFAACGCIGVGMVIMAVYAQLFSKPMRNNLQPAQDAVGVTTRQIIGDDDQYKAETESQIQTGSNDGVSDDLFGGLRMIFRYEYLKLVLAASVLYEIALTCMHYELNLIGLDRFGVGISIVDESEHSTNPTKSSSEEGITYIQFMGWYGQTVNILSLFLSFYAFPRLIKNYGLSTTIRIFPTVLLLVTIFAFVMFPRNLYFLFISLCICKALTYSVHDPSEEVLYMPTSDAVKFKAKFWIDVVGQRIAKAIGSAINNYAGSVEGIVKYGSLPSIVTALILWLACYQVGILFDGLIKSGNVVGVDEVALEQCNMLEMSEQVGDDDDSDESDLFRDPEEDVVTTKFGKANRTLSGSEHVLL